MESQGCCRLAVLVKDGLQVKVLKEYMNQEIASVWLTVTRRGAKKLHIGAMYRQHHLLRQPIPNMSGEVNKQTDRYKIQDTRYKMYI